MRYIPALALALSIMLAACADPSSTNVDSLYGSWVETQALQRRGSMNRILTFKSGATFTFRVESFGVHGARSVLSAYSLTTGAFQVQHDRLLLESERVETWDSFYAEPGPFVTHASGMLLDSCTFLIRRDELTLRYLSYPADAPVETVMRLRRRM
jgi:hypothetical protein